MDKKPDFIIMEQNVKLLKGKGKTAGQIDEHSNYGVLFAFLEQQGYEMDARCVSPKPRLQVNRDRAWVCCMRRREMDSDVGLLAGRAAETMDELQANASCQLGTSVLLAECHNREYWLREASSKYKRSADDTNVTHDMATHEK